MHAGHGVCMVALLLVSMPAGGAAPLGRQPRGTRPPRRGASSQPSSPSSPRPPSAGAAPPLAVRVG
eukprot:scaffold124940_cov60-Phaeocystis_antarctica.AAC.2